MPLFLPFMVAFICLYAIYPKQEFVCLCLAVPRFVGLETQFKHLVVLSEAPRGPDKISVFDALG